MRSSKRFTFHLISQVGSATPSTTIVNPSYKDLVHKFTKENSEVYCNESCDTEFTFLGSDFVLIRNADIRTKFTLVIYDNGIETMRGVFRKTDGDTDINHNSFKVKISIENKYGITSKFDDEYDLIKLKPAMCNLSFRVKPVLQIYELFSDTCYNYCGTELYAKKVTPIEEMSNFWAIFPHEVGADRAYEWNISTRVVGSVLFPDNVSRDCTGVYKFNGEPSVSTLTNNNKAFQAFMTSTDKPNIKIRVMVEAKSVANLYSGGWASVMLRIEYFVNATESIIGCSYYDQSSKAMSVLKVSRIDMKLGNSTYQNILQQFHFGFVVKRLLFNSTVVPTAYQSLYFEIGDDDPLLVSENYNACYMALPVMASVTTLHNGYSSTPTEYGLLNDQTNYYSSPGSGYAPMMSSSWFSNGTNVLSWWLNRSWTDNSSFSTLMSDLTVTKMLKDWYSLGAVIKVLLAQIDSSIVFEEDVAHSSFLFNTTNPVTNESQGKVYILQKSNILNFDYDMAAWKAPITFNNVLNLLRNAFNCYWDVYESSGTRHFRIEHISYYMKGNTYSTDSRTATNLSIVYDKRSGKPSSFLTNRWSYVKESQANRYEFGWMDEQTALFDGQAIEIRDDENMFTEARKEERKIDFFSSDMDAMMFDTDSFSQDGFVVAKAAPLTTELFGGTKPVAIISITLDGVEHQLQNGLMSMAYLQEKYMAHNLYPKAVKVNGHMISVPLRKKMRTQDISFFLPSNASVRPGDLVTTEVGDGEIESMSIDMTCGLIKATVIYPFEAYSGAPTPVTPTIVPRTIFDEPLGRINKRGNNTITLNEYNDLVEVVSDKPNRGEVVLNDDLSISQTDDEVSITLGGNTYTTSTSDYTDSINNRVTNLEESLPTEDGVVEYIASFGYDGRTAQELPNEYVSLASSAYSHDKLFLVDGVYAAKSIGSDIQPYLVTRGWAGADIVGIRNAVGCDTARKQSILSVVVNFRVSNNTINQTGSLYYYEQPLLTSLMNAVADRYNLERMDESSVLKQLGLLSATPVYSAVVVGAIDKNLVFKKDSDIWWDAGNSSHIGEGLTWLVQAQEIINRHEPLVAQYIEENGSATNTEISEKCGSLNREGFSYEPLTAMYMATETYPGSYPLVYVDGKYSFRE